MAWIEQSVDKIVTGDGIYVDIQVNLIEIIKSALLANPDYHSIVGSSEFYDISPKLLSVVDTPAFYIWVDGGKRESNSMGGMRSTELSHHDEFFVTIQFLHNGADQMQVAKDIRRLGAFIEDVVTSNFNLNDLMNKSGEVISIDFLPKPVKTGGKIVVCQGFNLPVIYKRTSRQRQSQR